MSSNALPFILAIRCEIASSSAGIMTLCPKCSEYLSLALSCANLRFSGIDGHALLGRLDQRGVMCSQSSACTNRRPEPSYVLRAMGLSEDEAYASVRFSFSELNSEMDVQYAIENILQSVSELKLFSGSAVFAA